MENRIQELTDKIFQEGVEKGNLEAQKILDNAKSEAERIVEEARATGERIVKEARKKADELSENVKSELKLYSRWKARIRARVWRRFSWVRSGSCLAMPR